jgi:hypothetical protein
VPAFDRNDCPPSAGSAAQLHRIAQSIASSPRAFSPEQAVDEAIARIKQILSE